MRRSRARSRCCRRWRPIASPRDEVPAPRFDPSYAASPAPEAQPESAPGARPAKPASTLLARQPAPAPPAKPKPAASPLLEVAVPAPPPRPTQTNQLASLSSAPSPGHFDHFTAIYDLSAHTVYMPDGSKLEAHSGLGDKIDNPQFVDERNQGATPPHLYSLSLREELFHGVQALRLTPVGGSASIFGRDGILAHSYMLGPNGDSNGCVSFKNYDAFLQAFRAGRSSTSRSSRAWRAGPSSRAPRSITSNRRHGHACCWR